MRNNYLSQINFKVKLCQTQCWRFKFFFNVVNVMSHGVFKRHVGRCNHGVTWSV